ncbi:hypothetical protein FACS189459_4470 [Bacilli bacterium]|nr:hypothetical protein FACS189459_4470 [Bacilli bacterium]
MEYTRIILKPLHSEKTYAQSQVEPKRLSFIVSKQASKYDIKIAFSSIYGIVPVSINTRIFKSTAVRSGTAKPGFSKEYKIATILLPKGANIGEQVEPNVVEDNKIIEGTINKDIIKKEVSTPIEVSTHDENAQLPKAAKKEVSPIIDENADKKPTSLVVEETYNELEKIANIKDNEETKSSVKENEEHKAKKSTLKKEKKPSTVKVPPVKLEEKCPECGGDLLVRAARKNGERFVACSNFPKCKYTRPFKEGDVK